MINFSKVDVIPALIEAVKALPESTITASKEDCDLAKQVAIAKLNQVTTNGAHLNIRVNSIGQWFQTEIQVAGQIIKPATPAGPVAPPVAQPVAPATK